MSTTQDPPQPAQPVEPNPPAEAADGDQALGVFSQPAAPEVRFHLTDPRAWLNAGTARAYPIIMALIALWIAFDIATGATLRDPLGGTYFHADNISNILVYTAEIGIMAIGVVVILLLGEIDLSIASTAALAGTAAALMMSQHLPAGTGDGSQAIAGISVALIVGLAVGAFQGFWVAYARVPSFVVTLAGLLGFLGVALVISSAQTTPINSQYFNAMGASSAPNVLNGGYLAPWLGVVLAAIGGVGYTLTLFMNYRSRRAAGLPTQQPATLLLKGIGMLVLAVAVVVILNHDIGVPLPVLLLFVLLVLFAYILQRTRFGRHIYATGGNTEAARRAGVDVRRLRWAAFVISGLMAGVASVVFMARLNSASAGSIGSDQLLNAIAAAVIGGTSLFGGRGTVWAALLGALVLSSVQTGMDLTLAGNSNANYYESIVKGAILLLAVWLDTFAKSRAAGRPA